MTTAPQNRWLAINFAATIFTSAFLLFQVQPLISKYILPWFGGTPAVWTTCMLFFQSLLFVGYAYAHFSARWLTIPKQVLLHGVLIAIALALLPIVPSDAWKSTDSKDPAWRILAILASSVGLPYFVLSSSGPLIQSWFARTYPAGTPYRLYALSNIGSLLALLSYPFFFERKFDLPGQASIWCWGFVAYAATCGYAAVAMWAALRAQGAGRSLPDSTVANAEDDTGIPPTWIQRALWLLLPAFASVALLATTNQVCSDICVMPFLWILPLSIYLLTFIVAFDHPRWYRPVLTAAVTILAIYLVAMIYNINPGWIKVYDCGTPGQMFRNVSLSIAKWKEGPGAIQPDSPEIHIGFKWYLALNCMALFGICMMCHGELVRLKPHPRYLTSFYLMIAGGGALGGVAVSLIAPHVFATFAEWNLSLIGGFLMATGLTVRGLWQYAGRKNGRVRLNELSTVVCVLAAAALPIAAVGIYDLVGYLKSPAVEIRARNFFGTVSVIVENDSEPTYRQYSLRNGRITHGVQFVDQERRHLATTYYAPDSGVGRTIGYFRQSPDVHGIRIGAVGLGTGTLAAYVDEGDSIHFYEIDPKVIAITEPGNWFTFLKDCRARGGRYSISLGDARLSLERESREKQSQRYHVLVLDAFSGDAIPVHLLTEQAFETYLSHLTTAKADGQDGAIAVHITNRYVDLEPVVLGLAEHYHLSCVQISNADDLADGVYGSDWMILSKNPKLIAELQQDAKPPPEKRSPPEIKPLIFWTDQRSSLFDVLK